MNRRRVKGLEVTVRIRCPKHPSYMAQRRPNGCCSACSQVWQLLGQLRHSMPSSGGPVRSLSVRYQR